MKYASSCLSAVFGLLDFILGFESDAVFRARIFRIIDCSIEQSMMLDDQIVYVL